MTIVSSSLIVHAAAPLRGRRITFIALILLAAVIATSWRQAAAQTAEPGPLTTYVTDVTGTLSAADQEALNARLATFDKQTSTQIVVVVLSTLHGEPLEEASRRIVIQNRIGQKGRDNGVLLLVVRDERKIRIEVGRGLEGVLTDALSSQIIRKEIVPHFRAQDYPGGIAAGVDAVMAATRNEYTADPAGEKGDDGVEVGVIIAILIVFFIMSRLRSSGLRRGGFFPPMGGGFGGGSFGGGGGFGGGGFSGGGGSFGGGGASGGW